MQKLVVSHIVLHNLPKGISEQEFGALVHFMDVKSFKLFSKEQKQFGNDLMADMALVVLEDPNDMDIILSRDKLSFKG